MSQRWLKFLEKFGSGVKSPDPPIDDATLLGTGPEIDPKMYEHYEVLFHLYGPLTGSPWVPYQCPTIFASIDKLNITPDTVELSPGYHEEHPPQAWQWLSPDTMVIVDLPDGAAIEVGVTLMKKGAQFVSTFDHWPFSSTVRTATPVIKTQNHIDTMRTLAPEVHALRQNLTPDVAPIWLCDSRRLGDDMPDPTPGTFDNRYYIDDSILPGVNTLQKGGIRRIVHLNEQLKDDPLPDLVPFIIEANKAGIAIEKVAIKDKNTWVQPQPMTEMPFKTRLPIRGFRRTDMGGFGKMVPVPSEGSYGSGGGGG